MTDYIPTPKELMDLSSPYYQEFRRAIPEEVTPAGNVILMPQECFDEWPKDQTLCGFTVVRAIMAERTNFVIKPIDGARAKYIHAFKPKAHFPPVAESKTVEINSPIDQIYQGKHLEACRMDRPGPGGACHQYEIFTHEEQGDGQSVCRLHFQEGPVKDAGINGVQHEALVAVIIDRLQAFQTGPYSCRENAIAITKLEEALMWLDKRASK